MSQKLPAPHSRPPGLPLALFLLFLGAFLRAPAILLHGRIWAEESSIFLIGAWDRPFVAELLKPEFGYYSLWDNFFAALAAHALPLSLAALLFTWSAVLLLLVTGYFLYQAEFLPTRLAKTVGVLALLLTPSDIESWLNLINSEFYFGILAAVILCSDAARLRLSRALLLALAVLSGPLTTLLAPFFFLRALLARRRPEVVQAAIVSGGALVQLAVAMTTSTANRKVQLDPLHIGPVLFNKQVVFLFFNRLSAKLTYNFLLNRTHFNRPTLLLTWLAAVLAAAAIAWLLRRQRAALVLLSSAFYLAVVEDLLALNGRLQHVGPGAGERYSFTPDLLIELALLAAAVVPADLLASAWQRTVTRVLLGLALFSGFVDYLYLPLYAQGTFRVEPWRQQVLRWQHDPSLALQGSPQTWVPFHLQPKNDQPAGK